MKKLLSSALIFTLLFSTTGAVFAAEPEDVSTIRSQYEAMTPEQLNEQITADIGLFEEYFENENTSVTEVLSNEIARMEVLLENESDSEKKVTLNNLIQSYRDLILDYEKYTNDSGISAYGIYDAVYSPMVAAIVTYFSLNNYQLSAELLVRAKDGNGYSYVPYMIDHIYGTPEYVRVRNICTGSSNRYGDAEFNQGSSTAMNDLYYAIHGCDYEYVNQQLTFIDKYDFAFDLNYDGLAGTAVNAMYFAQRAGVIDPYYLKIRV